MTDEELLIWLRVEDTNLTDFAADRIEALTKERDQHWDSFVHWRKEADARSEQLAAARDDAKEAEAYAEELEKELNTCRMAQVVMDNTVADLEAKLAECEARLRKAVVALEDVHRFGVITHPARATLAEIKGEIP